MIVECHHKPHKRNGIELKCKVCDGVFYVKASRAKKAKTCSKECKDENQRRSLRGTSSMLSTLRTARFGMSGRRRRVRLLA